MDRDDKNIGILVIGCQVIRTSFLTFEMDRPPLVPQNEENHDILPLVTEIFQDTFRTNKYPENVAENLKKYAVDADFTDYRENGVVTIEVSAN
jgi:hypothetical protein